MAQNGLFAHKSKQINTIHRQLTADFHPAVKNVASAGQNLLRAYQNLSRNHYVYTASLYALAFSSSTAEKEVQGRCRELEQMTEALKAMNTEQTKWVDYFTNMTLTINRNCENEKERLKAMQSGFARRERELGKAVGRGKQTPEQLDNFYERELAEARDQQAQRYAFFVEKHQELLRQLHEWTQFSTSLLGGHGHVVNTREGQQQRSEEAIISASAGQPSGQARERRGAEQQQQQQQQQVVQQMAEHLRSRRRSSNQQQQPMLNLQSESSGGGHRRRSTLLELCPSPAERPPSTFNKQKPGRAQHQQGWFRPIPVVLPESQQKFRHSLAEAVSRVNGELTTWERQQMMTLPAEHSQRSGAGPQQQQPPPSYQVQYYRDEPPGRGSGTEQLDRVGLAEEEEEEAASDKQGQQQQRFGQPQQHRDGKLIISSRGVFGAAPPSMKGPAPPLAPKPVPPPSQLAAGNGHFGFTVSHGRGQSQESTASSGMARFTPTIFASADFGRLVECTTPYEAQGPNQLSLNIGQRVLLVKSGTRGWVLGRSEDGHRHGWFPAKYLKLV